MNTQTDIANHALGSVLGIGTISNINDSEKAAQVCLQFLQTAVDAVISGGLYPDTVARESLTPFGTPITGWLYSYQKPLWMIEPIALESDMPWAPEGGRFFTDDPTPVLIFKKRPTSYGALPNTLNEVFGCKLAELVALELTSDDSKLQVARFRLAEALELAKASAGRSKANQPTPTKRWGKP